MVSFGEYGSKESKDINPNFARLFEKRYRSCHCEHFVPQHKLSEAIPGPDLACTDTVMEKQASCAAEAIAYSNHVALKRAFSEGIAEPVPSAARNLSFRDLRPLYFSVLKERL